MDKWEQLKLKLEEKQPEVSQKGLFQKKYAYREVSEWMEELNKTNIKGDVNMKFYEFSNPYFALIKAENKSEAVFEYEESVGYLDGEEKLKSIKEVDRDYALAFFSRVLSEDGNVIPVSEIVSDFQKDERMLLVVDGALA
ncbi:hypothetical protein ACI3ER_11365 [Bacillus sp. Wb]